MLGLIFI